MKRKMTENVSFNITKEDKDDIAIIMRQTECYNVKFLVDKFIQNNKNVLDTVCDIMNIEETKDTFMPKDQFTEIREAILEKDNLFQNAMAQSRDNK